jgi:hypothetical protein
MGGPPELFHNSCDVCRNLLYISESPGGNTAQPRMNDIHQYNLIEESRQFFQRDIV